MSQRAGRQRIGIIGKDGRTSAIRQRLEASPRVDEVIVLSAGRGRAGVEQAIEAARLQRPDMVVVSPEEPLALGVVDAIQGELGIPCIGPTRSLARLESSKAFTRRLLATHGIAGNPRHRIFRTLDGIEPYLVELGEYVVKPDGLTGGKGVKVSGEHLRSLAEGLDYCREVLAHDHACVVVEERLEGEEFSLQSFCDGTHVADMVVVQDHKRAHDGDTGPNTGGMGSYTCADHLLPFIDARTLGDASAINARIAGALLRETGERYRGILFGGFMATADGVRLLEYNARFGDPESLNVLSLLETDLFEVFEAMVEERLDRVPLRFKRQASVCRYLVPNGYPVNPVPGMLNNVPHATERLRVFTAAVEDRGTEGLWMTGSRALALVGLGDTLEEANRVADTAAASVQGPAFYRRDIGAQALIDRRIAHMRALRAGV